MCELGTVGLEKDAFTRRGTRGRDVRCAPVQFLDHTQRRQSRTPSARQDLEPPSLLLTNITPGEIEIETDAAHGFEVHEHRVFDGTWSDTNHLRAHPHRLGEIAEPQRKVEQRVSKLEEHASAGFRSSEAPSLLRTPELVLPCPYSRDRLQLPALNKAIELLHVSAEAVVVADDYHATRGVRRLEDPLDTE